MTNLPASYDQFARSLKEFIPEGRIITDSLRTLAYGTDASFYRLIPKVVVTVEHEDEVIKVLKLAASHDVSVTFRAAGTSLSGQAITDSVLVLLSQEAWRKCLISADSNQVTLQPGVIGAHANQWLSAFKKKIGPDPASINSCKIGGIAANNASGMCCGTAQNSYKTLVSMRIIFSDGTVLDTGDGKSKDEFQKKHPDVLEELTLLRNEVLQDDALNERIQQKFKIKNTTGYSLNALVDFEDPFEILQHLMIGSEGTLGFISEITLKTVDDFPDRASALPIFPNTEIACSAIPILKRLPVSAVEIMDRASLRSVEDKKGVPSHLKGLPETATALLIETRGESPEHLQSNIQVIMEELRKIEALHSADFTDKKEEYTALWNIRKGLFPAVGAVRENGTTVIIEDIAFSVDKIAPATLELQELFKKHDYTEAIIFGHALEGNLHFVITQGFSTERDIERYRGLMNDVATMVVEKYDGSLKAEHGTGRNMAPFVEMEWGRSAYELMKKIKATFDPTNLLNPGVILNSDPDVYLKNIKPLHPVHEIVDKCIECGFCEQNCPSRALSLTPRQRIVGLRELARLEETGEDRKRAAEIKKMYQYQGVDTCAADGLCALSCPVDIDTGKMMKVLREKDVGVVTETASGIAARNYGVVSFTTKTMLGVASVSHKLLGETFVRRTSEIMHKVSGRRFPVWNKYLPSKGRSPKTAQKFKKEASKRVVYIPACISQMMGPASGEPSPDPLPIVLVRLLRKAGYDVVIPKEAPSMCCGHPFESKGMDKVGEEKLTEFKQIATKYSKGGKVPILVDASPCSYHAKKGNDEELPIYDITEFLYDFVLPELDIEKRDASVALHPTCSIVKMGLQQKIRGIAEACAKKVTVPTEVTCCGWAGDRGFFYPELNEKALYALEDSLPDDCHEGYSSARTCEIGMSLHSDRYYRSIVYLLDECSQPKKSI